ncbi:MAG: MFS transporter [Thermomicrobiales bacterium]|nr:MFS transporter [Thermomicrobiales bacterium]
MDTPDSHPATPPPLRQPRPAHRPRAVQRTVVRPTSPLETALPAALAAPLVPAIAEQPPVPALAPAQTPARRRPRTRPARLLDDEQFRAFWLARLVSGSAQGALLYAFLLLVADQTDRATFNSIFVICAIIPTIVFGLPGGIVVDAFPRRGMLIGLNLLRFGFAVALVLSPPTLPGIFAAVIGLWTIQQFYAPAESAALIGLIPRARLTDAQALSNFAGTLSQLVGLAILAPLMLKTTGPRPLYAVCAALWFVAAGMAALLPPIDDHLRTAVARRPSWRTLIETWRSIRRNPLMSRALAADVLVGIGMSSLLVIMPLYLKRVLGTPAENTVFVFAPASVGLVLGLRLAPGIGRRLGDQRVATLGLAGFAVCVALLGFVGDLRALANDGLRLPLDGFADLVRIPAPVLLTMLISVPAGFCSAVVGVTARALLLAHTPGPRRGQTIATVTLMTAVGALLPTLLAGVAADLFGVERIAVAIAVAIAAGGFAAQMATPAMPLASPAASRRGAG